MFLNTKKYLQDIYLIGCRNDPKKAVILKTVADESSILKIS